MVAQAERMNMVPNPLGSVSAGAVPRPAAPACPQNWYLVARSAELKPGAILARALGNIEIVLYRGNESSRAVAFAAHCAHAGCHLRHGKVVGDGLRCALHHRTIRDDGRFIAKDGSVVSGTSQFCLPVIERFDCVFVFAGKVAAFDLPMPEICALGPFATRSLPPKALPLSWSTLVSNGMDIDHLQAVHGRALREPPTFVQLDRNSVRLSCCARVTGTNVSDRVMKWIAKDEIRLSLTCVGGSMLLVESLLGRHRSFVMLSMCPAGQAESTVRAVAGIAGAPSRATVKIAVRLAAWLFGAFLKNDIGILQQMNWHAPEVEVTLGDTLTRRLGDYFRGLPEFDLASAQPAPNVPTFAMALGPRPASRVIRSGRGA
jgi:phenylpropionate dioxygenase-like ring-hydroxylating dioxygenase large terminal subunit